MKRSQLQLEEAEEVYLTEMRALSTNEDGERILVGLTLEESIWYIEQSRKWLAERLDPAVPRRPQEDRKRLLELNDRHEVARLQIIGAEHEVRTEKPTRN